MRDKLALASILALAAIVRFYRVDLTWFFLDQVRDVSVAANIAAGASFPLLGPRIGWTEAYLGPLYFYLLAIPFSISRDPVAGIIFVAAFHLVALLALYRFAREFFGASVALYASAFFAVFPLTVFSSRLVWHTGLLPPLIILYMHALFRLIIRGQSAAVVALFALLAVLTQLHLTSIALGGVALVAVVVFRPTLRIVHVLVGMALFLVLYLPYVAYEVAHGFANVRELLGFAAASEQGGNGIWGIATVSRNLLFLFLPTLGGFIVEGEWSRTFLGGFRVLYASEALLFAIGLAVCVSRLLTHWRRGTVDEIARRRQAVLLLLWVSVPILMLGTKRTAIWWYYLDSVYPSPFILAGIALTSLPPLIFRGAPRQKRLALTLACLAAAIVASQVYFLLHFQRLSAERGELLVLVPRLPVNAAGSHFGALITLPLGYRREIVETLVREFGVKDEAFFRKVHGAVLGLAEENRYLVDYLSTRRDRREESVPTPDAHYLVAKAGKDNSALGASRSRRVGPYTIYEYRPLVDYAGWSCSVTPESGPHAAQWIGLSVPATDVVRLVRRRERLFCRGTVHVPPHTGDVKVAVSLMGQAPFEARLHVDGRLLSSVAREGRQEPLMLKTASGWSMEMGWASETVFDLTGSVQPGDNVVTI
jgi:4-amino-4-deoxy-L-arabinose transferase-like glycosyltransferase